jgi:hypothetical protein
MKKIGILLGLLYLVGCQDLVQNSLNLESDSKDKVVAQPEVQPTPEVKPKAEYSMSKAEAIHLSQKLEEIALDASHAKEDLCAKDKFKAVIEKLTSNEEMYERFKACLQQYSKIAGLKENMVTANGMNEAQVHINSHIVVGDCDDVSDQVKNRYDEQIAKIQEFIDKYPNVDCN